MINDDLSPPENHRVYEHDTYGRITLVGRTLFGFPIFRNAAGEVSEYEEECVPGGEDEQRGYMRRVS